MIDSSLPPVREVARSSGPKPWLRAGLWIAVTLLVVLTIALSMLDPWLRRTLEKQTAKASQGQYHLVIEDLRTHLWSRTVVLRGVHLRSVAGAKSGSTQLPGLSLDVARLRVAGIGVVAALRRQEVPLDSLLLTGVQLQLGEMPPTPKDRVTQPLYQRLPLGLPGLRVGYLALQRLKARYGNPQQTQAQVEQATLIAHDVYLSAAGAADTTRLGYAAALSADVRTVLARLPGHVVRLQHGGFSSASQRLTLDSVRLVPLQAISNQRTRNARADITLPHLVLTGLQAAGLPRGRFLADDLHLAGLRLLATMPGVPPPPLHKVVAPYLPSFRLRQFRVTNAKMQLMGLELAPAVRGVNLTGTNIHLQPDIQGQLFYARAWTLRTGQARLALDAPYYRLALQAISADTRRRQLELTNVAMAPTMSVAALARGKGHQSAHVRVRVPQMRVSGLDIEALLEKGDLLAQQFEVRKAWVLTESDGRFPLNPNQSVATPDAIGRLPFRVDVRQVRFTDLGIRMSYRSPRSAQPGVMAMQQLNGVLSNVSNNPRRMSTAHPMTGQVTGRVQQLGAAQLSLRANVLDPSGVHTISGRFAGVPLAILNPMILPTRGLRLRSGQIEQMRFQMQLNRQKAQGTLWAEYHDLKLQLLNRENRPGILHRLETSVVNGVFLRDNNPRKPGEELKPGKVNSRRELRYSVFSLWRQGLVSGMLNSAGVPEGLAKKLSEME
ncbi:DUF748 domain-containing protein [Hymenobacter sp. YC55]|uniref:DUF748 domain-containing protein n=1 Tax=Hymenobacter sp. YC55 TaxID=3034019 RepID=UPI0023F822E0|nr:DUF748 domain-containing protein [Hymenobacter sp. YC55]MDF7812251.1 DUF748 domain-containing protein [Hymenobacter sp. YC55]